MVLPLLLTYVISPTTSRPLISIKKFTKNGDLQPNVMPTPILSAHEKSHSRLVLSIRKGHLVGAIFKYIGIAKLSRTAPLTEWLNA
jgi:hypothetical protein